MEAKSAEEREGGDGEADDGLILTQKHDVQLGAYEHESNDYCKSFKVCV